MTVALIEHIKERIDVNSEELNHILTFFKPLSLKKNEVIITHGETNQRTFFVSKGCLRIFFINEDGQDSTRYFAFENQMATALVSFITGEPSEESIQATEDTELLYITQADFHYLLETLPQWEKFYRQYLEKAYINNTKRLMSCLTQDALGKYRQLLLENPIIARRLPNKMVASYLNISQETLSRLKAKV